MPPGSGLSCPCLRDSKHGPKSAGALARAACPVPSRPVPSHPVLPWTLMSAMLRSCSHTSTVKAPRDTTTFRLMRSSSAAKGAVADRRGEVTSR